MTGSQQRPPAGAVEVQSGLWMLRLPHPKRRGAYSLAYLLRSNGGLVLIDAGWQSDPGWRILEGAARQAGGSASAIEGVLLTHLHPDHVGLIPRVRAASDAWVGAHRLEVGGADRNSDMSQSSVASAMLRAGMGTSLSKEAARAVAARLPPSTELEPDRLIEDGEEMRIGERTLSAVWTPGHTAGHLVFHDALTGTAFAGDLALPTTITSVGAEIGDGTNPLAQYLQSLGRLADLAPAVTFPGHESPYTTADTRCTELERYHSRLLEQVLHLVAKRGLTTWEVAERLDRHSPVRTAFGAWAAVREAAAYLRCLEAQGDVRGTDEERPGIVTWSRYDKR